MARLVQGLAVIGEGLIGGYDAIGALRVTSVSCMNYASFISGRNTLVKI